MRISTFKEICIGEKFKLAIGDKEVLVKRIPSHGGKVNAYGLDGGAYLVPDNHLVFVEFYNVVSK